MEQGYTSMNGMRQGGEVFLNTSSGLPMATYTNQSSLDPVSDSSYLTPTSPVSDKPPQVPAFPAHFSRSLSQPHGTGRLQRNVPFPRADSGIETDVPRSPTSASSTGTGNPPVSTLYEYIDPKDVHVEPGHHDISTTQGESTSSGVSTLTAAPYSGDTLFSDSEDGTPGNNAARRRINPMYEALENSATRLYAQTCHSKVESSTQKQLRCLWCASIVLIVIIVFLLGIMAYMLFALIPSIQVDMQNQDRRIKKIELDNRKLTEENSAMLHLLASNESKSDSSLASTLVGSITQLNDTVWTVHSQLDALNVDIRQQIANISLTPGPEGPAGVANLSRCFYKSSTSYQALPGPYSTTSWQPSLDVLQENLVMSAACGVIGGTLQFVESKIFSANSVQFRCRCDGDLDGYDRRSCKIHLILCPRLQTVFPDLP